MAAPTLCTKTHCRPSNGSVFPAQMCVGVSMTTANETSYGGSGAEQKRKKFAPTMATMVKNLGLLCKVGYPKGCHSSLVKTQPQEIIYPSPARNMLARVGCAACIEASLRSIVTVLVQKNLGDSAAQGKKTARQWFQVWSSPQSARSQSRIVSIRSRLALHFHAELLWFSCRQSRRLNIGMKAAGLRLRGALAESHHCDAQGLSLH